MTAEREAQYLNLIEQLLRCSNGQEPEILEQIYPTAGDLLH